MTAVTYARDAAGEAGNAIAHGCCPRHRHCDEKASIKRLSMASEGEELSQCSSAASRFAAAVRQVVGRWRIWDVGLGATNHTQ